MKLAKRIAYELRTSASEPHPVVVKALEQAMAVLQKAGVKFWPMGGIAVNKFGVGRPTKDIDFLVPRSQWNKAVESLKSLAIDQERMGLAGEPEYGCVLTNPDGVKIEVFPTGFTAREIALLGVDYRNRTHPGSLIPAKFPNASGELKELIIRKLSSFLSSTSRLNDLGDIQQLVKKNNLGQEFASQLPPELQATYLKVVRNRF